MTRTEIESALLTWMSEEEPVEDANRFEELALALYGFQFESCEIYRRYSDSLGATPATVSNVAGIPPVPTGAFKEFDLRCFASEATQKTFLTSGTSREQRGRLHLDTLELYEASLLSSLRRLLLTDLPGVSMPDADKPLDPDSRPYMRFLAPGPNEAPDSSLTHMFETLRLAAGHPDSGYDLHGGLLDIDALRTGIDVARRAERPILLAGTSFAFVHLLDETREARASDWTLPKGSRVMETGGFKGRSREVARETLRKDIARRFAIAEESVINQYGMTELGSQFYDSTLVDPDGPRRKLAPPWTRVRFVDPETSSDVRPGEVGLIVIHDLANTGSIAALLTEDRGRAVLDERGKSIGFEVLGRAAGAEIRGCSVATDAMIEAARTREPEASPHPTTRNGVLS